MPAFQPLYFQPSGNTQQVYDYVLGHMMYREITLYKWTVTPLKPEQNSKYQATLEKDFEHTTVVQKPI